MIFGGFRLFPKKLIMSKNLKSIHHTNPQVFTHKLVHDWSTQLTALL